MAVLICCVKTFSKLKCVKSHYRSALTNDSLMTSLEYFLTPLTNSPVFWLYTNWVPTFEFNSDTTHRVSIRPHKLKVPNHISQATHTFPTQLQIRCSHKLILRFDNLLECLVDYTHPLILVFIQGFLSLWKTPLINPPF